MMLVQSEPPETHRRYGSFIAACGRQYEALYSLLRSNNLGRRVVKNTIGTTIAIVISVIPAVIKVFGAATFLSPMTTVFAHPGQRLGMMVESQFLILAGTTLGMLWGLFGIYLSNFVFDKSVPGAYSIRSVFLVLAIIFHGYLRSYSPRLFNFVLYHLIVATLLLTKASVEITASLVTDIFYPILTANGVIILVNIFVYPETASTFIGKSTIQTLFDTVNALRDAGDWFIEEALGGQDSELSDRKNSVISISAVQAAKLANLAERKAKLRTTLAACKKAQAECNFELSYSVLPPRYLKPISTNGMTSLVQSTIALIGACESKYALVGDMQGNQMEEPGSPLFTKNPFEAILEEDETTPIGTPGKPGTPGRPGTPMTPSSLPRTPKPTAKGKSPKPDIAEKLKLVKPQREVESGDAKILELILTPIRKPIADLKEEIDKAIDVMTAALSYSYDIRKLPSGWVPPDGMRPEEIDIRIELFTDAIETFDQTSADALASAAALENLESPDVDIMPRMETFLISSFLLSLRQAALNTMNMLRHSRILVQKRVTRNDRRRFYFPKKIVWHMWLASGGEEDNSALPENARKEARRGVERHSRILDDESDSSDSDDDEGALIKRTQSDIEMGHTENTLSRRSKDLDEKEAQKFQRRKEAKSEEKIRRRAAASNSWTIGWMRQKAANAFENILDDEDLSYAMKMAAAIMLVTWPAFVDTWKPWYSGVRGVWAPLQLIMVFEVSIGTSFWVFCVRLFGVVAGCVWGFLAYQIGGGNPYTLCVICMLGVIPGAYVQVGTKYVKAGMIGIISMAVVALVSYSKDTAAWEIFVQRLVAFIVGGTVAILVEIVVYPVRARGRLVECLSSCISQMSNMQAAIAVGVDDPKNMDLHSPFLYNRFRDAKEKAQSALSAAETFLPFCLSEPRLKGSFRMVAPVYKEIIYVLHQIIDRMDNMLALRKAYGSSVLEELNDDIFAHRRNVAAAVTLTFFTVNEALVTRMPLPQFLPSSRLAQLRLVNKVRHSLMEKSSSAQNVAPLVMTAVTSWKMDGRQQLELSKDMVTSVTQQKFLAWNAAAAGQIEIIEYLEELVDLAKLLVGVNAFKSGMLERPSYVEYVRKLREKEMAVAKGEAVAKAKDRGEDMEGMVKAVGDVDMDADKAAMGHPGGMGPLRRSSSFAAVGMGGLKRRFTFATPSVSAARVPGLGSSLFARVDRNEGQAPSVGRESGSMEARESLDPSRAASPLPPPTKAISPPPQRRGRSESIRDQFKAGRLERRSTIRMTLQGSSAMRRPYWEDELPVPGASSIASGSARGAFREEDEDEAQAASVAGSASTGRPSSEHCKPSGEFRSVSSSSKPGRKSSERKTSGDYFSNARRSDESKRSGEHQQQQQSSHRRSQMTGPPGTEVDPQTASTGSATRDDIPISLQRVRTRMMDERGVAGRRRRLTLLQQQHSDPGGAGGSGSSSGSIPGRIRAGSTSNSNSNISRGGLARRDTIMTHRGRGLQSQPTFGPAARMMPMMAEPAPAPAPAPAASFPPLLRTTQQSSASPNITPAGVGGSSGSSSIVGMSSIPSIAGRPEPTLPGNGGHGVGGEGRGSGGTSRPSFNTFPAFGVGGGGGGGGTGGDGGGDSSRPEAVDSSDNNDNGDGGDERGTVDPGVEAKDPIEK